MSAQSNSGQSGCKFPSALTTQLPRYDNAVYDRKLKIHRPRKTARRKPKFVR